MSFCWRFCCWAAMLGVCGTLTCAVSAADLATVSLFDAERTELVNNWGGAWGVGNLRDVAVQEQWVHSGRRALRLELGLTQAGQLRYAQCLACGFGHTASHFQTRDLARFNRLTFYLSNRSGAVLSGSLQIKDYRDSLAQRAVYRFAAPKSDQQWTRIDVPLTITGPGWQVDGQPDLRQVLCLDFGFRPQTGLTSGAVYLDDLTLTEPGGPADVATTPLRPLVERLTRRQWDGLWAARSRRHGLMPNTSYQSSDGGLNTTAAVLWMLPAAVRHGWVPATEADDYVQVLLGSVQGMLAPGRHLPPRNMDWATLEPSLLPEESAVDAAFLALALHQYRGLPRISGPLRTGIAQVQERLDFASFAAPGGWRMAYRYATPSQPAGFAPWTYDGYTNEANIISLAAQLCGRHPVPIETYWNSNKQRARIDLAGLDRSPVVHVDKRFRAPFAQALLNLFVDVRQRGFDTYPDDALATNPWQNFVLYEHSVMARLARMGRANLVQPDAGDDGTLGNYQQFSLYEDFGQNDLFMPWSAALPLLAEAPGAEAALRFLLEHGLHGPLGLADSAKWKTGEPEPYRVTARHDFWNTALGTMALLEWLDGDARLSTTFAALPEVRTALDRVFRPTPPPAAREATRATTPPLAEVRIISAGLQRTK